MMSRKIIGYCAGGKCCGSNPCYLDTNIKSIATKADIPYESCSEGVKALYGIDNSPTTVIMKEGRMIKKFQGKMLDKDIERFIDSLGWS